MNVFNLLDNRIQSILKESGLDSPTEAQRRGIPVILEGKNVLLIAPTGLGKTEAVILPVLNNFLKSNRRGRGISILYITPLRALNRDMLKRTLSMGKKLGISIAVRHGDTPKYQRAEQTKNPPDMLITTPETFQILFTGKRLRNHLKTVRWVIIDEIHELAGEERGAQLAVGLERLEEITFPESFQRIGLSATVGSPEEIARYLGGFKEERQREVRIVEVDVTKKINIEVELIKEKREDRKTALSLSLEPHVFASLRRCRELVEEHRATLVFVNTRDTAEILGSRFLMWDRNFAIDVHHGSLSKNSRIEAEDNFKNGRLKALICTSSLELGIDVGHADFVIQYSSPRQVTRLLQRVGRSGHRVGGTSEGKIISPSMEDFVESIVIANRALNKKLENIQVRRNPLSVLANQIISIALEYKSIDRKRVYEIIRRAYPFSSLSGDAFNNVLHEISESSRRVKLEGDEIKARIKSRLYFIKNISMIPDERNYIVIDIASRKKIGILDESFVLSNAYEGSTFILHGRPWKVVKIEEDSLLVSPINEIGRVPSWVGEDIPVPFEIAQEVGALRREIVEGKDNLKYPCSREDFDSIVRYIKGIKDFAIPSDKTITIDVHDKVVVINACFGTKVNETLGRILSSLLTYKVGESVRMGSDPYRIILEFSRQISVSDIEEVLLSIEPEGIETLLKMTLKNSTFLKWYLIHTARKFGAISEDFSYSNIGTKRLFELFDYTMIMEETLNKAIWEKMDIENTKRVLKEIREGKIKIVKQGLSPFSMSFDINRGLMLPERPESVIIDAIERRLEEKEVFLVCLNCMNTWRTRVGRAELRPKCPRCGAFRIAIARSEDLTALNEKNADRKRMKNLSTTASLVLSYGKFALLTLAGRGIGAKTAARILRNYRFYELKTSEEKRKRLLKDIWRAELQYAQTRGFWEK